ncbi:MAG: LemA family protein [Candidatus Bipolaricaulota bacterium]|nr:LemA family protein [Candidatus Bipolaricaulota bacterium]
MSIGFILILIALAILGWGVLNYNRLVKLGARAEALWRDIGTQLKRRWDLIPTLVETIKAYATQEKEVFEQVELARARAIDASTPKEQAIAEEGLKEALRSLFVVVENYPELKSDQEFLGLQQTMEKVDDAVQRSRTYYNAVVHDLNTRIRIFPQSLIANMLNLEKREYYMRPGEDKRELHRARF